MREGAARLSWGVGLIVVAMLFAVAGAAFCLWSLYQLVLASEGSGAASLITGLTALVLAAVAGWAARRVTR